MSRYSDISCDLINPSSLLDFTAVGILTAVNGTPGQAVHVWTVDNAIIDAGGELLYKGKATRALRNLGYHIIARKAGPMSWYKLAGMANEYEDHRAQFVRHAYSAQVGFCREMTGAVAMSPNDLNLAATMRYAQLTACSLGADPVLSKTIAEVLAELQPI